MIQHYINAFKKYADISGRATRSEFWYFTLANFIVSAILSVLSGSLGTIGGIVLGLYGLGVIVPSIAITVRRLHDTNRSGWWFIVGFVPVIGLALIIFLVLDSVNEGNKYGVGSAVPVPPVPPVPQAPTN
ncbi:MAG: DUF805 domain-containing protein [Candidatus Jorgensenbacteria bacterium]|nr:DUF805 domain-containing protein [Candidatus Jorgensenbacteria bacterium]